MSDGTPRPYWDFPRLVWKHPGDDGKDTVILPQWVCFVSALFLEMSCDIFGGTPSVPKFIVDFATRDSGIASKRFGFFYFCYSVLVSL